MAASGQTRSMARPRFFVMPSPRLIGAGWRERCRLRCQPVCIAGWRRSWRSRTGKRSRRRLTSGRQPGAYPSLGRPQVGTAAARELGGQAAPGPAAPWAGVCSPARAPARARSAIALVPERDVDGCVARRPLYRAVWVSGASAHATPLVARARLPLEAAALSLCIPRGASRPEKGALCSPTPNKAIRGIACFPPPYRPPKRSGDASNKQGMRATTTVQRIQP